MVLKGSCAVVVIVEVPVCDIDSPGCRLEHQGIFDNCQNKSPSRNHRPVLALLFLCSKALL